MGNEVLIKTDYDRATDLMFVDLCDMPEGTRIDVVDVGDMVGFPGQVLARVDLENRIVYGMTIQGFSSFKRKLRWKYRMASVRLALMLLINTLRAGLRINSDNSRHAHLPA